MRELRAACETEDGTDHQRKGTHLLEVLALEIQMYTETKNNKKLKVNDNKAFIVHMHCAHMMCYNRNFIINAWVSNLLFPILVLWASFVNVVERCICGRVSGCFMPLLLLGTDPCLLTEEWDNAQTDFFESFKNYDEAGSPQRIQVLK